MTPKLFALRCMPFVGINFIDQNSPIPIEAFCTKQCGPKDNRISIVLFGWEHKTVDDKKYALIPHKYHQALENGWGQDVWTEKLCDPYLCGAFPFYHGCSSIEAYFPRDSFCLVDIEKPDEATEIMVAAREGDLWNACQTEFAVAKYLVLDEYHLVHVFADLSKRASGSFGQL